MPRSDGAPSASDVCPDDLTIAVTGGAVWIRAVDLEATAARLASSCDQQGFPEFGEFIRECLGELLRSIDSAERDARALGRLSDASA